MSLQLKKLRESLEEAEDDVITRARLYKNNVAIRLSKREDAIESPDLFLRLLPTYYFIKPPWAERCGLDFSLVSKTRIVLHFLGEGDEVLNDPPDDVRDFIRDYESIDGESLLHLSVLSANRDRIKFLIEESPSLIGRLDATNKSFLEYIFSIIEEPLKRDLLSDILSIIHIKLIARDREYMDSFSNLLVHEILSSEGVFLDLLIGEVGDMSSLYSLLTKEGLLAAIAEKGLSGNAESETKVLKFVAERLLKTEAW